jgi:hypothetical protein
MFARAGVPHNQLGKALFASRRQHPASLTRRAAPERQMLRRQTMAARNRAHLHAWLDSFSDNRRLDLIRTGAASRRRLEDIKPAYFAPRRSQQMLHSLCPGVMR